MSQADKTELVANFTSVTGVDTERARFYLEAAAWKLDIAMSAFFEEGDDVSSNPGQDAAVAMDRDEPAAPQVSRPGAQQSRFGTISALKDEEMDSDDDERDSFYAGGSEHGGGQQVLGAKKKKKKPEELVQDMFKSAKEHGAEEVASASSSDKPAQKLKAFRGTGYKLGETEESSQVIEGAPLQSKPRQVDMVLKLWKSGFSVDDGPLRDYHDQENQEFLGSIKKGEVPRELVKMAKGGEVNLNMEDHREEEYVKPKVAVKAFSGEGMRLGSATPEVVASPPVSVSIAQASESAAKDAVQVDQSQPTTSVQIRLSDGSRLVAKFNHSHKVSDIRTYITTSRPQFSTSNFVLMTTFPNKEISDESETIEQAKLQNAVIVQRMK